MDNEINKENEKEIKEQALYTEQEYKKGIEAAIKARFKDRGKIKADEAAEEAEASTGAQGEPDYPGLVNRLKSRLIASEIKAALLLEGVDGEKAPFLARMIEPEEVLKDGEPDSEMLSEKAKEIAAIFAGPKRPEPVFKIGPDEGSQDAAGGYLGGIFGNKIQ